MNNTTKQREIWELEHRNPQMFKCVDSDQVDDGIKQFTRWITDKTKRKLSELKGLDICCGKGRNTIWLAKQGIDIEGCDWSEYAITSCQEKLSPELNARCKFSSFDVTQKWPFEDDSFDFVIDSFGSSDITTNLGRKTIAAEAHRVLKSGGVYFMQVDSPELGFFKRCLEERPREDKNTLTFPNGKIEFFLNKEDIENWNKQHPLKLLEAKEMYEENIEIYGILERYKYYWIIAQKSQKTSFTP